MKTIKFSHEYDKFPPDDSPSVLLQVFVMPVKELSSFFVDYDTKTIDGDHYKLPSSGKVLVLLLYQACNKHLWTTIRRQTPAKESYYQSLVGREVSMSYPSGEL